LAIVFVGLNFRSWVIGQADRSLLFFALVLPALSAAPFIVEVRFFMPLIFGYSALGVFTLKDGVQAIFRKGLHVHCLGFIALCLLHSAAMYDHLKHVVLWQAW